MNLFCIKLGKKNNFAEFNQQRIIFFPNSSLRSASLDGDDFTDEDDYHFQTKQITILSQDRKSFFI